jgi:hypothetical protein
MGKRLFQVKATPCLPHISINFMSYTVLKPFGKNTTPDRLQGSKNSENHGKRPSSGTPMPLKLFYP